MWFQRCANPNCSRPFQVNEFPMKKVQEAAQIVCPHCGHATSSFGNSVFLVHAMLPEQEAQFEAQYPRRASDEAA